ncbi:MAG: DNA-3-methyladenine glycosylase, partial [Bryobacteraceae bacterium]
MNTLPRTFYSRPTAEVARDLLGKILVHGDTAGRIVEVEAYLGLVDLASHASKGRTPRTQVMFGPPGHAYVYFIYGMYECFNVVTESDGTPGAVLVRALEPVAGIERMFSRRPAVHREQDLCSGPGKLTLAMDITRRHNGRDLTHGDLRVEKPAKRSMFLVGVSPRIGIRHCTDWPLRFFVQGSAFVSKSPLNR